MVASSTWKAPCCGARSMCTISAVVGESMDRVGRRLAADDALQVVQDIHLHITRAVNVCSLACQHLYSAWGQAWQAALLAVKHHQAAFHGPHYRADSVAPKSSMLAHPVPRKCKRAVGALALSFADPKPWRESKTSLKKVAASSSAMSSKSCMPCERT